MQLVLLLWNLLTHLAGIYLFTRGFLLTRLSLPNISSPVDFPAHQSNFTFLNASLTHALSSRANSPPPLQTHTRAILLLIDSLRFDFISPHPPTPPSPYHHNVLTLPRDLTATRPRHSFIFNAYSDPPTTTLQRIKALMTGTLPTFVDIGGSFGTGGGGDNENRTEVAEDSVLKQMNILGKRIAFMGDDTWLSVFPSSFSKNLTFPFDSFNVEDLHTVDEGVISHLFPLLESTTTSPKFDFLIGHFLGVDHVGHRLGPEHPSMKHKLQQMNEVLKRVVDRMDASTLLIVLGDHGMDRSGDHGGDGVLETSAGMWIYSKGPALMNSTLTLPESLLTYQTFPGTSIPHRSIQQIDILPSLSLLLGLPIPYNNLGTVIPELFWRDRKGRILEKALEANARQVWRFLETYRGSRLGGELDEVWEDLVRDWEDTQAKVAKEAAARARFRSNDKRVKTAGLGRPHPSLSLSPAFLSSTRRALSACRAIWAQFNPLLMSLGLVTLTMCLVACWTVCAGYSGIVANARKGMGDPDQYLSTLLRRSLFSSLAAALFGGVIAYFGLAIYSGVSLPHWIVFFASVGSSASLILYATPPKLPRTTRQTLSLRAFLSSTGHLSCLPIILILHSLTFVSNSFTFWEDRLLPFLLLSSLIPYLRLALHPALFLSSSPSPSPLISSEKKSSPPPPRSQTHNHPKNAQLRTRFLLYLALFAFSVRLMALSTVCREEQQPYCRVTFYQASSVPQPPWVVLLVLVVLLVMGTLVIAGFGLGWRVGSERQLPEEDEDFNAKLMRLHLRFVIVPTLIAGTSFWLVEWVDSAGLLVVGGASEDAPSSSSSSSSSIAVAIGQLLGSLERWLGRGGMETGRKTMTTISSEDLRTWRTYIAWLGVLWCLCGGGYAWVCWLWWGRQKQKSTRGRLPPNGLRTKGDASTHHHSVPTQALSWHDTPYVILWTTFFGLVYICTQLTGQVVLLLSAVALLSFGEVVRCARVARGWVRMYEVEQERETFPTKSNNDNTFTKTTQMFKFTDLTPVTLLSLLTFYATGHQANVPSIQWKAAFVLCERVQYPLSVVTMVLNELGGVGVVVIGVGVVIVRLRGEVEVDDDDDDEIEGGGEEVPTTAAASAVAPSQSTTDTTHNAPLFLSLLSLSMHFLVLLLGSSIGAAILRRHLMVWKVFAPRFMAAVVETLVVDLGILGVGVLGLLF